MDKGEQNVFDRMRWVAVLTGAAAFLSSSWAAAGEVTISSVKPLVLVQRADKPDKWFRVKAGAKLKPGDAVRTGKGGQAGLELADGSRMTLGPLSRMVVREAAEDSTFDLSSGWVKAIVKKVRRERKFQVKTPLAAASVRGTVFEIGYSEDSRQGYLDVSEGTVALMKDGQEVLLNAGQRLDFLPDVPLGAPGAAPKKTEAGDDEDQDARAEVRHEVGLGMDKDQVMAAAAEEMRLAEYQEGKTLIDVFGKRVRLEEYVIRRPAEVTAADRDKAFKLVVLNERDDRFDYFYYRGIFNQSLPEDLSVALNDLGGRLSATAPSYYLTSYEMGQSNTIDTLKDVGSGGHLVKVSYDGTNFTLEDPTSAANTRTIAEDEPTVVDGVTTQHKVYDPVNDRFLRLTDAQFLANQFRPAVYNAADDTFRTIVSGDTYWRTGYNSYSHALNGAAKQSYALKSGVTNTLSVASADLDADFTYAGGTALAFVDSPAGADMLHERVRIFYGDGTFETYNNYIISDEGEIGPVSAFAGLTTGRDFKNELLKWNYQQVTTASEFQGRKIDLVVEPKILIKAGLIE